jgi:hypothetical protein
MIMSIIYNEEEFSQSTSKERKENHLHDIIVIDCDRRMEILMFIELKFFDDFLETLCCMLNYVEFIFINDANWKIC